MNRIWLKSYPHYADPAPAIPNISVADQLREACARYADNEAYWSMGVSMNYRELENHALCVTSWLQQSGVEKGDRVAIMLPNLLSFPVCLFGALLGGYTCTNINPQYTPRELIHQLNDSGAKVLFVLEGVLPVIEKSLSELALKAVVVVPSNAFLSSGAMTAPRLPNVPHALSFDAVLSQGARTPARKVGIAPDDIAFLQYTGGTTGVSKGAMILHRNVIANITQINVLRPSGEVNPRWARLRSVQPMPLYHAAALLTSAMLALTRGSACILIPNPRDIDSYVNVLLTQRFSTMAGLNTLYNALLNHPKLAEVDFSHCVVTGAGGMATQKAVADRWQQTTGLPILEAYGLTEATCYLTATPVDAIEFTGSVGLPLPLTDVSIRNDAGAEVASGEHGEVCARGPQIMAGYWNRPAETEQAMTADGYLRTGDIGWMDEKGYLYISDRKKDMLLVSGFNVFPNEIEGVLATHPGVVESAVVGMPDAHSGEVPIAYVVRRNASLDEAELLAFCRERLTGYKCPKSVVFIDILPKSPVGKVLRRELRSQASIAT